MQALNQAIVAVTAAAFPTVPTGFDNLLALEQWLATGDKGNYFARPNFDREWAFTARAEVDEGGSAGAWTAPERWYYVVASNRGDGKGLELLPCAEVSFTGNNTDATTELPEDLVNGVARWVPTGATFTAAERVEEISGDTLKATAQRPGSVTLYATGPYLGVVRLGTLPASARAEHVYQLGQWW
jgi:hypothetical protein